MSFTFTQAGFNLVEQLEGLETTAYLDSGGVWTIGYGHTGSVREGETITLEEAKSLLLTDLQHAQQAVDEVVGSGNWALSITNNQYSALVIFAYNIGDLAFSDSTLAYYLNNLQSKTSPSTQYVAYQMRRWNTVRGKVNKGLVNRREAEIKLWNTPDKV